MSSQHGTDLAPAADRRPADPAWPAFDYAAVIDAARRHLSEGGTSLRQLLGEHLEDESHGAYVWTHDDRRFINCAGYGVFLLGATHPRVTFAVVAQVLRHPLSTRVLLEPLAAQAARTLAAVCPNGLDKVHFVGSGTEATETAIKLARAHGKRRLITTEGGFHGKTMGSLSLTARPLYQDPFRPLLPDTVTIPYGDAAALASVLSDGVPSCFVVEPVQGEGGVIIPPPEYLAEVTTQCQRSGCFFVLDEILTGLGRLGRWWGGAGGDGVAPDVLLVGKGLSGGVIPVAAAIATPAAYAPFNKDPFLHTSTFSAAPVAMAAVKAAIEALREENAPARAQQLGAKLQHAIAKAAQRHCPHLVREIRGEGLLIGVDMASAGLAGELMLDLAGQGVLINHSLNNSQVLRLTPPVVLSADDQEVLIEAFETCFARLARCFPRESTAP